MNADWARARGPEMPQYRMWWLLLLVLFTAACERQAVPATGDADTQAAAQAEPAPPPVVLEDVIERDSRYIVGISYSPIAKSYPGLAALLLRNDSPPRPSGTLAPRARLASTCPARLARR